MPDLNLTQYGKPMHGLSRSTESTHPPRELNTIERAYPPGTELLNPANEKGILLWWVNDDSARILWDGPADNPHVSYFTLERQYIVRNMRQRMLIRLAPQTAAELGRAWSEIVRAYNKARENFMTAFYDAYMR